MHKAMDNPTSECIDADITCIHCGYNLRTLPRDGNCPECASPVVHSVNVERRTVRRLGTHPAEESPRWQVRVAVGFVLYLSVAVIVGVNLLLHTYTRMPTVTPLKLLLIGEAATLATFVIGAWLFTSGSRGEVWRTTALRIAVRALIFTWFLLEVPLLVHVWRFGIPASLPSGFQRWMAWSGFTAAWGTVAGCAFAIDLALRLRLNNFFLRRIYVLAGGLALLMVFTEAVGVWGAAPQWVYEYVLFLGAQQPILGPGYQLTVYKVYRAEWRLITEFVLVKLWMLLFFASFTYFAIKFFRLSRRERTAPASSLPSRP